jgi:hypothetical protein
MEVKPSTSEYIKDSHYRIESIEVPNGYTFYPIKDAIYIDSYERYNKKSLVFNYDINCNEFFKWLQCWTHIANNKVLVTGSGELPYTIQSHIHDFKIKEIYEIK